MNETHVGYLSLEQELYLTKLHIVLNNNHIYY